MNFKVPASVLAGLISGLWACESASDVNASACSTALESVSDSNAAAILQGAVSCFQEDRQGDANFLMIMGQIRGLSDLSIFTPSDDENFERAGELYTQLWFNFGGLGSDEFYRTPANVDALEERIRNTDLSLDNAYDPGWSYRPSSKTDIYPEFLANVREHRIWQMRNEALRLQDDEYYEVRRALDELQRESPAIQSGTPAFEEHQQLMERMMDAVGRIPELPPPEDTIPYARLIEQDPELAERQVATGFNGPASQGTHLFRSEEEVRRSWLAAALSDQEMAALMSRTDFSTQVLVGFSFGKRMNASGRILISELRYRESGPSYTISTRLGVVPESCGFSFSESYPFVIGVTENVPDADVGSYFTSNFPDECGPTVSAEPAAQP